MPRFPRGSWLRLCGRAFGAVPPCHAACPLAESLSLRSDLPRSLISLSTMRPGSVPSLGKPVLFLQVLICWLILSPPSSELEHCKSARLIPKRHGNLSLEGRTGGGRRPSVCVLALFLALASDLFSWRQRTRQPPATPNTTFHSPRAAISHVFRVILAQGPETLLPRLIWKIVHMLHWWALHLKEQQRPPAAMVALPSCHSADFSDISTSVLNPPFRVSVSTSSHRSPPSPVTCYRRDLPKYST